MDMALHGLQGLPEAQDLVHDLLAIGGNVAMQLAAGEIAKKGVKMIGIERPSAEPRGRTI